MGRKEAGREKRHHIATHPHTDAGTQSPLNSPASAAPSPICIAADMSVSLSPSPPAAAPPPTPGLCSMGSDCARGAHWAFLGRGTLTRAHTRPRRARAPAHALTLTPAHTHAAAALMCSARGFTCNVVKDGRLDGWSRRVAPARDTDVQTLLGEGINPPPLPKKRPESAPYLFTLKRNLFFFF